MKKLFTGKWSRIYVFLLVASVPLLLIGCGSSNPPAYDISGAWYTYYATHGTPGEVGPNLYALSSSNNAISGSTSQNQIITGEIAGLDINFSYVQSDGSTNNSMGTISSDGTTMSGTWTDTKGRSGTWHAIYQATNLSTISIAGNWSTYQIMTGSSEQGPNPFTFNQSGDSISGTTSQSLQFTGSISYYTLTFFWIGTDGVTYTFTGTVNANGLNMSGTWINTTGQSGTWRAVKM